MPVVSTASASRGLFLGKKHAAVGLAFRSRLHGCCVGGTDLEVMMDAAAKARASQHGLQNVRQKQVRNFLQTISGGRMPGDADAQTAQLLDETPHRGTRDANLVGDLGAAHHHHGMVGEKTNDTPQALVGAPVGRQALGHCDPCWKKFSDDELSVAVEAKAKSPACIVSLSRMRSEGHG